MEKILKNEFYTGILELGVDHSRPDLGYPGAWLIVGNKQIHLLELRNPDPVAGRPAHGGRDRHLALQVTDLDRVIEKLESRKKLITNSKRIEAGRRGGIKPGCYLYIPIFVFITFINRRCKGCNSRREAKMVDLSRDPAGKVFYSAQTYHPGCHTFPTFASSGYCQRSTQKA